jgi:hypothetical protein
LPSTWTTPASSAAVRASTSTSAVVGRDRQDATRSASCVRRGRRAESRAGEHPGLLRQGKPAAGLERAGAGELARDLERVERVPGAGGHDAHEHGPREDETELALEDVVQRRDAERVERDLRPQRCRRRALEGLRTLALDPDRHEHCDGELLQPADGEREGLRGRGVEPLRVVDGDHDRAGPREFAEHREHAGRDRASVEAAAADVRPEQGDVERAPLERCQPRQHLGVDGLEQVAEPCEGELRLGSARARREHGPALLPRPAHALCPDGRLPDPRRPCDRQRPQPRARGVEEGVDLRQLCPAADGSLCWHAHRVPEAPASAGRDAVDP